MRTLLLCLLGLCLGGCSGILTSKSDTPDIPVPAALPPGWGYALSAEFLPTPAPTATASSAVGSTSGVSQDVGDAAFGVAAWLSKAPLIGWMFAARVGERASRNMGGRGESGPVTPAVMIAIVESGRVLRITWTPVRASQEVPAPVIPAAVPAPATLPVAPAPK